MAVRPDVMAHLTESLKASDPFGIEANVFERRRRGAMARMIAPYAPFERICEIGPAAGVFSAHLAFLARQLVLIDVIPEAISRCRDRLAGWDHVDYCVQDVMDARPPASAYDLVVVAEVLYYLSAQDALDTVTRVIDWVRPGGFLLFSSATSLTTSAWQLGWGAERADREWARHLRAIERTTIVGSSSSENAWVCIYQRDTVR